MLYAHNQMRSKSEHTCDPLHLALYLDPDRDLQRRIWLPILADPRMMEECVHCIYYDLQLLWLM
jgi:hypothetical protein